jgi:hypothetical protein
VTAFVTYKRRVPTHAASPPLSELPMVCFLCSNSAYT